MKNKRILILVAVCLICIGGYILLQDESIKPSKSVVDIAPKSAVTEPWPYTKHVVTKKEIIDSDGNISLLPVADVTVTNKRDGKVVDIFRFDATRSYNPISDQTKCIWIINGRKITDSKRIDLRLDKKKNYTVVFHIFDTSKELHLTGASARFEISLHDVYYKLSQLDTGVEHDK